MSILTDVSGTVQFGKRRYPRLPKNPMDKATIVSIYPRDIHEDKPTIFPQHFHIPAPKTAGGFSLTIIDGASHFMPAPMENQPPTEVQIGSTVLADSIVKDLLSSIWLSNLGERGPGVFWVPGEWEQKTITNAKGVDGTPFDKLLEKAKARQTLWFTEIMNAADELWARTNGNPRSIPDDARLAAVELGVEKQKPWMQNNVAATLSRCPACGSMIDLNFPVCKECKAVINAERAKELGITFSK